MKQFATMGFLAIALITFLSVVGILRGSAQTVTSVPLSNNLGSIPTRADVTLGSLPGAQATVDAGTAIAAAEAAWHLPDANIDRTVGVVRALFSLKSDRRHQSVPAVLVVANARTFSPALDHTAYNKLVIVVDAVTGKVVLSYPVDPLAS